MRQYEVGNFLLKVDVVKMGAQQNQDALNLVAVLTYRDAVHLVHHQLDVVVDAELRHLLRMDYFQDAVDVGPLLLLKMDCYLDEVQLVHREPVELKVQLELLHLELQQLQQLRLVLPRVMPSTLPDQHRARQQVQLRVLD